MNFPQLPHIRFVHFTSLLFHFFQNLRYSIYKTVIQVILLSFTYHSGSRVAAKLPLVHYLYYQRLRRLRLSLSITIIFHSLYGSR